MEKTKKIVLVVVAFLLVAGGAFYAGVKTNVNAFASEPAVSVEATSTLNADMSLFWSAVNIIKTRYYDAKNIKDDDLLYGAISGMMASLDDPYSVFFAPSDAKKFHDDLNGSFGGIGAEIGLRNGMLTVISPIKESPAEKAGIKAGDNILKVDDTETNGMALEEAVKIIRGEPNTEVSLLILREGWTDAKVIKVTRKIIEVPTLDWEMKDGNIAYFNLYSFNANAPQLFYEKAVQSLLHGTKGIVLDLRNDPGGFLDVATNIAGWFVPRGNVIVQEKLSGGQINNFVATGNQALAHIPVVVLINGGSASASEILAGALRDVRGAKLVGEKSYGKGSVQEVEDLKNGAMVKVSIAEWLTPDGHFINKVGLIPDIEVTITDQDIKDGKDPQLDKAIEVLKTEMGK